MSFVCFTEDLPINNYLREKLPEFNIKVLEADVIRFADGEFSAEIHECVRGKTVFIVGSLCTPVNDNLMKITIMADALHRASASKIVLVVPYLGYARQDRRAKPRQPITAALVARFLEASGIQYVVTIDLHSMQTEGFYTVPFDNLSMIPVAAAKLKDVLLHTIIPNAFDVVSMSYRSVESVPLVVAPDHGGVVRARVFANVLGSDMAIIDKQRLKPNEVAAMKIIGDVQGRNCIIVDDLVDTGNTLCKAAALLREHGAKQVSAYCTHPVLSGDQHARLKALSDAFDNVYLSDTIYADCSGNIKVISCKDLILDSIIAIDRDEPISEVIKKHTGGF